MQSFLPVSYTHTCICSCAQPPHVCCGAAFYRQSRLVPSLPPLDRHTGNYPRSCPGLTLHCDYPLSVLSSLFVMAKVGRPRAEFEANLPHKRFLESQSPAWLPTALGIGEAAVFLCALHLISLTDTSTGRGQQLLAARCIIAAASAFGVLRYGPPGIAKDVHFFFRQFANAVPITIMSLSVLTMTAGGGWAAPLLAHEGSAVLAAGAAALAAFFTGNEVWTKAVAIPAFLLLAGGVAAAVASAGFTPPLTLLSGGVAIFAVREGVLRAALPGHIADPLRRVTLVVALQVFAAGLA